jgi:hypothetical protein
VTISVVLDIQLSLPLHPPMIEGQKVENFVVVVGCTQGENFVVVVGCTQGENFVVVVDLLY